MDTLARRPRPRRRGRVSISPLCASPALSRSRYLFVTFSVNSLFVFTLSLALCNRTPVLAAVKDGQEISRRAPGRLIRRHPRHRCIGNAPPRRHCRRRRHHCASRASRRPRCRIVRIACVRWPRGSAQAEAEQDAPLDWESVSLQDRYLSLCAGGARFSLFRSGEPLGRGAAFYVAVREGRKRLAVDEEG